MSFEENLRRNIRQQFEKIIEEEIELAKKSLEVGLRRKFADLGLELSRHVDILTMGEQVTITLRLPK